MKKLVKEIDYHEIGNVKFFRSNRAKRSSIKVNHKGEVFVVLPKDEDIEEAEKFVNGKLEWIRKTKQKVLSKFGEAVVWDKHSKFKTKYCDVKIFPADVKYVLIHLDENLLEIQYPQDKDVKSEEIQNGIKFGITETLRLEAKDYLPERVKHLAGKFGLKYNRVYIKHQKTRWGSYSAKGNINLNLELMLLPDELIDFIILHELAHSRFPNHGKEFHRLVNKITGGKENELEAKLSKYWMILH